MTDDQTAGISEEVIPVTSPNLKCSVCDEQVTGLQLHTGFPMPCGHVAGTYEN